MWYIWYSIGIATGICIQYLEKKPDEREREKLEEKERMEEKQREKEKEEMNQRNIVEFGVEKEKEKEKEKEGKDKKVKLDEDVAPEVVHYWEEGTEDWGITWQKYKNL